VERLTERLSTNLKQDKIDAVPMHSVTTHKYPLQLTADVGG
jgi:predicted neutral ceramidase superfamily lipid hydrolase